MAKANAANTTTRRGFLGILAGLSAATAATVAVASAAYNRTAFDAGAYTNYVIQNDLDPCLEMRDGRIIGTCAWFPDNPGVGWGENNEHFYSYQQELIRRGLIKQV